MCKGLSGEELTLLHKEEVESQVIKFWCNGKYERVALDVFKSLKTTTWARWFERGSWNSAHWMWRMVHLHEDDIACLQGLKYHCCIIKESKW